MTRKPITLTLTWNDRVEICNAINERLKVMVDQYHASCDLKCPNVVLFQEHCKLTALRDMILTGKTYAQQEADAGRAADTSERIVFG